MEYIQYKKNNKLYNRNKKKAHEILKTSHRIQIEIIEFMWKIIEYK